MVLNDILETEAQYVSDLHLLIEHFLIPMKREARKHKNFLQSETDIKAIFGVIEVIFNINIKLLIDIQFRCLGREKALETSKYYSSLSLLPIDIQNNTNDNIEDIPPSPSYDTLISDILLPILGHMKRYSMYVQDYDKQIAAVTTIRETNKAVDKWLKKQLADPRCRRMGLSDFLISPIQRIPQYQLLIKDLLKYTLPDHPDYPGLLECLDCIIELNKTTNQMRVESESMQRVFDINANVSNLPFNLQTPSRRFLFEECIQLYESDPFGVDNSFNMISSPNPEKSSSFISKSRTARFLKNSPKPRSPSPASTPNSHLFSSPSTTPPSRAPIFGVPHYIYLFNDLVLWSSLKSSSRFGSFRNTAKTKSLRRRKSKIPATPSAVVLPSLYSGHSDILDFNIESSNEHSNLFTMYDDQENKATLSLWAVCDSEKIRNHFVSEFHKTKQLYDDNTFEFRKKKAEVEMKFKAQQFERKSEKTALATAFLNQHYATMRIGKQKRSFRSPGNRRTSLDDSLIPMVNSISGGSPESIGNTSLSEDGSENPKRRSSFESSPIGDGESSNTTSRRKFASISRSLLYDQNLFLGSESDFGHQNDSDGSESPRLSSKVETLHATRMSSHERHELTRQALEQTEALEHAHELDRQARIALLENKYLGPNSITGSGADVASDVSSDNINIDPLQDSQPKTAHKPKRRLFSRSKIQVQAGSTTDPVESLTPGGSREEKQFSSPFHPFYQFSDNLFENSKIVTTSIKSILPEIYGIVKSSDFMFIDLIQDTEFDFSENGK